MSDTMTLREVAAAAELSLPTVRRLHADATKARREGTASARTMPEPTGSMGEGGALLYDAAAVTAWLKVRAQPARKGAVPKSVLQQAIKEIERGRYNAATRILKGALQ